MLTILYSLDHTNKSNVMKSPSIINTKPENYPIVIIESGPFACCMISSQNNTEKGTWISAYLLVFITRESPVPGELLTVWLLRDFRLSE